MTPTAPDSPSTKGQTTMFDHSVQHCRLLAVDDEEVNLALLRKTLERAGFSDVCTLSDPRQAMERITNFEPDLILLDLHMPAIDGYQILKQLREGPDVDSFLPVIVLTADSTDDATRRALALGANDFVTKPFQLTELLLRVHNLLEARVLHERTRRQNRSLRAEIAAARSGTDEEANQSEAARQLHRIIDGDGDGLVTIFQPILDLQTGRVDGAEALPRFTCSPVRPPEAWFRDAAAAGLGLQLEIRSVHSALLHAASLPQDVFASIDVSADLAASPVLAATLSDTPLDHLVIEVDERLVTDDPRALQQALAPLRTQGLRIAIDNVGAGHAGMQRILELRPDILKLDQTVIQNVDLDPTRRALVNALVIFGAEVGCDVLAQGIERSEELRVLTELGVTLGQSFYIAKPEPLPLATSVTPTYQRSDLIVRTEAF
jgi:EAL domain-containing protein (putative c-di-GMP-specific phosphodiesterase class I)/CheY-like chemotaxis protein